MHPLNIVILLPLYSSHISYKMTHQRNCLPQQTVHPSAPPCCSWAACVCVMCVNVCSLCVKCVCVCESSLDHFLWLWRWTGRAEFLSSGYLGVVDKEDCSCWLLLELSVERGSLNLDTEKEGFTVSPQWQITCLDRSLEFSSIAGCHWSGPYRPPQN